MAKMVTQLFRGAVWLGVLLAAGLAQAQTIRLQEKATVSAGDVRLGNIATISGVDVRAAEKLAETVIIADLKKTQQIRAENVLLAVVTQHGASLSAALQMTGAAACEVSVGEAVMKPVVVAAAPVADVVPQQPVAAKPALSTLTAAITQRIISDLNANADDVRVTIDTISPLMDQVTKAGQRWQLRPLARNTLGTLQFEAQLIDGVKVTQKLNVLAKVEKRTMVVICTGPVARGKVIERDDVKLEETWLDRNLPTLFTKIDDVLYQEATRALAANSHLDQRDFRAADMISKGDVVKVEFMAGTLKVEMKARAMQSAKMHDAVTLRNDATGETYQAIAVGKKLAAVGAAR